MTAFHRLFRKRFKQLAPHQTGRHAPEDDLYRAGLTSHASVNVMLAVEDAFDIEFPERLLRKSTFASIAAIVAAVDEVGASS